MNPKTRGLLPSNGQAAVVGLPTGFHLKKALKTARSIRLATAFAHLSGWRLIDDAVSGSPADTYLLAGLDFCQTDPAVLYQWLGLSKRPRTEARVCCPSAGIFHPKVLIVEAQRRGGDFAVVGSGNLSSGGLRDNVECSLFTQDRLVVRDLISWFDDQFRAPTSSPLTRKDIDQYVPSFRRARASVRKARNRQESAEKKIAARREAPMKCWADAVRRARRFFQTKKFAEWYEDHRSAARGIRSALKYPVFTFDRHGWERFHDFWQMGHLIAVRKNKLWRIHRSLQAGLRRLVDERKPVAERVDHIRDSNSGGHLPGFGINAVSKILAVHKPAKWPVFNKPVEVALKKFGYEPPRGASEGKRYEVFASRMKQFCAETDAPDMISLDCFFYNEQDVYGR